MLSNRTSMMLRGLQVGVLALTLLVVGSPLTEKWDPALRAQTDPIVIIPLRGSTPPLDVVTVNDGAGHQYHSHASADLVSYTDGLSPASIRFFRFSTGIDTVVPPGDSFADYLSSVSGSQIAFTRNSLDRSAIVVWDATASTLREVLPLAGAIRQGSAIGGNTVAFTDFGIGTGSGDVVAYDLVSNAATVLTFSASTDVNPNVAPDGQTIVWENCPANLLVCDVMSAIREPNTAAWSVAPVAVGPDPENNPDTDGVWIVYDGGFRATAAGDDIYFRPVSGGPTRQLSLPGPQQWPRVSNGVISFLSAEPGTAADLFVYVIATNTLYQVTATPGIYESLADILHLNASDYRLTWTADDGPGFERNVYATTFRVASASSSEVCLLYDPLVAKKSGSAYPIRLRLCDTDGNNLSSPSLVLRAVSVTKTSNEAPRPLDDTGHSNPDFDFRYDAGVAGYVFNLNTKGFSTGTYRLNFTVGADLTLRSAPFSIK